MTPGKILVIIGLAFLSLFFAFCSGRAERDDCLDFTLLSGLSASTVFMAIALVLSINWV